MNVFVSSVIGGLEPFREAASRAAKVLGDDVRRSEDFGATTRSPQEACLEGVRWADVVVLLLGERYGDPQGSGLSPTHEEYREAKSAGTVLAFVQDGVQREESQEAFVEEVRSWSGGVFTGSFTTPEDLADALTRALHEVELAQQAGRPDEDEMLTRAQNLVPDRSGYHGATLCLVTTLGPQRQVLRPSEIEDPGLARALHQDALFGQHAFFDPGQGAETKLTEGALLVEQQDSSLLLDPSGSVRILQPAGTPNAGLPSLIEEDVRDKIVRALRLTSSTVTRVDPVQRLTHGLPLVALLSANFFGWRTRDEQSRSPDSMTMSMRVSDPTLVSLTPPARPRAALEHEAPELADDFIALLRRTFRS
jgi:hypothetical protein